MPDTVPCPSCGSVKTMPVPDSPALLCYACKHEFVPEKPFVPTRVFISYGHDEHVSLAIHLRDDLRKRGHTVWFDEERLQPGHDWEAFIEKGLEHLAADKANAAVILLLTPHSVRRPDGYCLNEVARALSRGLRIIPLMVVESEPPLSICRIQWLDMRQCLPIHEKVAFYRPRFERLLKALEENQLDFEGTQQRLLKALQPLEFDADILRHLLKFTGRQWVFAAIDKWLAETPPTQRVFWISGSPGVGKTAISAMLSSRYLEVAAIHLCKFGHAQKSDPRCVITSVVYQLTTQLPEYEARLASMDVEKLAQDDARTMFDNLLVQPLIKLTPPNRAIVILIDALDEATRSGRNDLASFIAEEFPKTPSWLRLIITSRPEATVTAPLQGMKPFILDTDIESNRADIREYLRRELASLLQYRPDAEHIIEQVVEKSEGLFLYVERVCDDLQHGNLSLEHMDQFPQGLGGVYWQFFERQFPDLEKFRREIRPALRAILAAREPLPVEILQLIIHWQDEEVRDFTRTLGSLFPVTKEDGCEVIKPYHKSLADWLADEGKAGPYFVSRCEGDKILSAYGLKVFENAPECLPRYFIKYITYHLVLAGRTQDCLHLIWKTSFPDKARAAGLVAYVLDFCDEQLDCKDLLSDVEHESLSSWLRATPEDSIGRCLHNWWAEYLRLPRESMGFDTHHPPVEPTWSGLDPSLRSGNRCAVIRTIEQLQRFGLSVKRAELDSKYTEELTNTEIDLLAEDEHKLWAESKRSMGWVYGKIRDSYKRTHPALREWSELPDSEREKDRTFFRQISQFISNAGFMLVRMTPHPASIVTSASSLRLSAAKRKPR